MKEEEAKEEIELEEEEEDQEENEANKEKWFALNTSKGAVQKLVVRSEVYCLLL